MGKDKPSVGKAKRAERGCRELGERVDSGSLDLNSQPCNHMNHQSGMVSHSEVTGGFNFDGQGSPDSPLACLSLRAGSQSPGGLCRALRDLVRSLPLAPAHPSGLSANTCSRL